MKLASLFSLVLLIAVPSMAADLPAAGDAPSAATKADASADAKKEDPDTAKASATEIAQPVKRSIRFRGGMLNYVATPGTLTIRNDDGEPVASMFYTAYTIAAAKDRPRPLTFLFNGGPGSSSMWLHMGSFGPMKVDASIPEMERPAPFHLTENPNTLLDKTDLVFIDAVTTGLSRPVGKAKPEDFFGVDKDIDAFARSIQRYLTVFGRWNSPKFIIGESYGTTRAAGLSSELAERGVQLNGIVLVSTVLNFADFSGDQSLINFFPTHAADAFYHGKLPGSASLQSVVADAKAFAIGPYASALQKGRLIGDEEKVAIAKRMSELTGLSSEYILRSNLRVNSDRFRRELLRDRRQIIGRIDSRYLGTESDAAGEGTSYDPQSASISGAFVGALNDYLFRDLGFKTLLTYRPNNYGGIGKKWDLKHKSAEGPQDISDTSVDLAAAMRQNPRLKLLSVNGYYDLATPFFGADYEIGHMMLEPPIAANIRYVYYPAGHMMYTDPGSARQLKADLASFYDSAM